MAKLSEEKVIEEFGIFGVTLTSGSPIFEKLLEIGHTHGFDAERLCNEWVAFKTRKSCELDMESLDQLEGHLRMSSRKTPTSRRTVTKSRGRSSPGPVGGMVMSQENLDELFGSATKMEENRMEEELVGTYGTSLDREKMRGMKRTGEATPTNSFPPPKSRPQQKASTPRTPNRMSNGSTPYRTMAENGMLTSTPVATFHQRRNSGQLMCSLNDSLLPEEWAGSRAGLRARPYNAESALSSGYNYMMQKMSDKSLILLERISELSAAICRHSNLPPPLSVAQPSLEPAVFVGKVACEGEGHLNPRSCLLEGPSHSRQNRGACVRLDIPDSMACSLFPGQVVAVEGINNYEGVIIPSKIYDGGVLPPLPTRTTKVPGFTILCAAGPFSTTDNLTLDPLKQLLNVVAKEKPDILLLLGPFLDCAHPLVKNYDIPGDLSYEAFFNTHILPPIFKCVTSSRTKAVLVPSQRDVHHPWMVYPQPPFKLPQVSADLSSTIFCTSDPSTLDVGGLCVGVTSTDVLFHLSARTMFRGPVEDRMAGVARHLLQQQCYYPLLPAFSRETPSSKPTPCPQTPSSGTPFTPPATPLQMEDGNEVNLDLIHMFDYKYACMTVKPDILILPSNLKPFAKVVEGSVCINPGHLTKKASGGTFAKILVSKQLQVKEDMSSDIGVQILHI